MSARDLIDVDAHDFMENDRGELMLVLEGQVQAPTVRATLRLSSGRAEAVLHRGEGQDMRISHIHDEAMAKLRKVEIVVVTEMEGDVMRHSYFASVEQ